MVCGFAQVLTAFVVADIVGNRASHQSAGVHGGPPAC